ncbi:MAG: hypothetical protein IPN20_02165 [Haliscomenobacter sp.]|nr:hypothetical protein [Haliscomenobacter sp.]MBK8652740.1 hypothetical protein [Haliscomenobacter sp.]
MKKKFVIILLHSLAKQKTDPEKPEESRDNFLNPVFMKKKIFVLSLFISALFVGGISSVRGIVPATCPGCTVSSSENPGRCCPCVPEGNGDSCVNTYAPSRPRCDGNREI